MEALAGYKLLVLHTQPGTQFFLWFERENGDRETQPSIFFSFWFNFLKLLNSETYFMRLF